MVFGFGRGIRLCATGVGSDGVYGSSRCKNFRIDEVINIGSEPTNKICLTAKGVDDLHASIWCDGIKLFVKCLSIKGIYPSDKMRQPDASRKVKVSEILELKEREHIFIGAAEIFVDKFQPA